MVVDNPLPSSFLNFMVSPQVLIQMTRIWLNQGMPMQREPSLRGGALCCMTGWYLLQSQKYPWCVTGPLELLWEALKLQPHVSLHSSLHAVCPVPKLASLKIAWVPLCCRYFPSPENWVIFFNRVIQSGWFQNGQSMLSFLALSHLFVDNKSKCLCYKNIRDFMKELVQIQSHFTNKREGRTASGKQQVWVAGMLSGKTPYLTTPSPDSHQKLPLSSPWCTPLA